ncbi:MAG: hypothetical protein ACI8P0_005814, partial [Planctomycetaceae bacterium]
TTSARRNEHALANRKSASESDGKLHHAVHRTLTRFTPSGPTFEPCPGPSSSMNAT